jgi:hypothetical protein
MKISKKRTRKIQLFFWVPRKFEGGIRKHVTDSKSHGDVPNERSRQSSDFVSISRDLREIARTLEGLTANVDLDSDSIKRLWMSMA